MNKPKKREVIKNIAIVFLVIMLILTFFSNTIMNRTLPEVNTQSVTSGPVTTQDPIPCRKTDAFLFCGKI